LVLDEVLRCAGADLLFSDGALREGVLLDATRRLDPSRGHHLGNLRRRSVFHVMELCEDDPDHAMHIARLADRLFDGLAPVLGVADEHRELLEAAALLCNVGLSISHSRHHQHSYYVIRNSDHLVGFTDREAELIAQVARYHRKAAPSERHEPFAALDDEGKHLVRALAAILRIAVGLDRSHRGAVGEVCVEVRTERIRIGIGPAGADLSLELYSADERRGLLEETSGREVLLEQVR
jgi:exopolyphosphatase/guanosine-5'-triphosphate,3'-diphosphate pyrophosphatase